MIGKTAQLINVSGNGVSLLIKWCVATCLVAVLSACQTPPNKTPPESKQPWQTKASIFKQGYQDHADLTQWRYSAKVGVVTPESTEQANMIWSFDDQKNNIVRLFGPLGLGAIKIEFNNQFVVLSDRKGVLHQGDNAQQLLEEIVGLSIPIDALHYWLFSLPLPQKKYDYMLDEQQQLGVLRQLGWVIKYTNYQDYPQIDKYLARKIIAKKQITPEQAVSVTLITKTWK